MTITNEAYNDNIYYLNYVRDSLTSLVDRIYDEPYQAECRKFLAEFRGLPQEYIDKSKIFYVEGKEYIENFVTDESSANMMGLSWNGDNIFRERFIIPIRDMEGKVCGLVGYDAEHDIKYLFSMPAYFSKETSLYNLENFKACVERGFVIYEEGFFDSIRLSSIGFDNNLAGMGTMMFPYHKRVLGRIPLKILIPDADEAGKLAKKYWKGVTGKVAILNIEIKEEHGGKPIKGDVDNYLRFVKNGVEKFTAVVNRIRQESNSPFFTLKEYYIS